MGNHDQSAISRDELLIFLSKAKDELEKFTNCKREEERCKKRIKLDGYKKRESFTIACVLSFIAMPALLFMFVISLYDIFYIGKFLPVGIGIVFSIILFLILFLFNRSKTLQRKIKEDNVQRPDLQKKTEESMNMFNALWFFPDEYWYEYALTWMFQYVKKGSADSWKEVTKDFDKHWQDLNHQRKMEHIAQQTLEESKLHTELAKIQIDLANKNLSATRWAAAGSWAAAAGIWRR